MFTIWGAKQRFCDGMTRRNFLKIGAFGAGLSLADLLRAKAEGNAASTHKAAIMIYLPGGPSHIDMYDLKPHAPVEFRGEFKPIQTNVPGVDICEHFPMQARMWDKLACIRSLVAAPEHSDSEIGTGYSESVNRQGHHPSFGSVISKLRDGGNSEVPPYVSLRGGTTVGLDAGFLGVAHRAFYPSGPSVENLRLATGVTQEQAADRRSLLESFDTIRRDIDGSGTMKGMDGFTARAFDMVASGTVRKALDLSKEDPRVRDRYKGIEQFLLARRLVEAGVGCVTLAIGGWDTHSANFKTLGRQLPLVDRAVANLIGDLCDRGMDKDVVTVMWGEFGRSPKVGDSTPDGRGHWPLVMSALVAGGGLKMGQAIGTSSARAEVPKDRPYRVAEVLATLYQAVGIDPGKTFINGAGRPVYILDDRNTIAELL
ncbi:hypothetical protein AYO44_11005 [Planctomycetaceae bacterium SCGC AG-212-F19]|nr:hypothetical protein AYO44_11005 [Planctomycetaceae bacterium SCGC AG-212-F19]